jgi:hypothetical protein
MTDEKWMTRKMRERFKHIRLRSFESCRIPSVPDLLAVRNGLSFWIEGKAMPLATSSIPYSGGQEQWFREMEQDGVPVFVVALLTSTRHIAVFRFGRLIGDLIDLVNPMWANELENLLISSQRGL